MDNLSIIGLLELWELASGNVAATKSSSTILLTLYSLAYYFNKGGCYFAAFSFDEVISHASFIDPLSEFQYYLLISCIYCILYRHIEKRSAKLNTIMACSLIVLFNVWMAIDAAINIEIETAVYKAHTYIAVSLYLLLIITLLPWSRIGRSVGNYFRFMLGKFRYSDAVAYVWYNCEIHTKQTAKK